MLFKNAIRPLWGLKLTPTTRHVEAVPELSVQIQVIEAAPIVGETTSQADLRRQMYERIAQGNALAEAEDHARRMWGG